MWLGSGVIGGIGLGLGYISPVSTLIKWFPDRRGMATGMAIMGFGGGAMIGAPLADMLMNHFRDADLGRRLADLRHHGRDLLRVHAGRRLRLSRAAGRLAARGLDAAARDANAMITQHQVHLRDAHKTPQFWLIWVVLCLNVCAGIGVIGMASPMLQEIFGGSLIGLPDVGFAQLDLRPEEDDRRHRRRLHRPAVAVQHRRPVLLGLALGPHRPQDDLLDVLPARHRALRPGADWAAHIGSKALFVLLFCIILSMYGGGFATVPAYLADIFGTQFVGAIHGRLLTAWSTAGIIGPVIVNYIREYEIAAGVPRATGSTTSPCTSWPACWCSA